MSENPLADAIEAEAQEMSSTPGLVLVDWIAVAVLEGWDDAGDRVSNVLTIPGGGAHYRLLGLLDTAAHRLRADDLAEDDDAGA